MKTRFVSPVFVGREEQLDALRSALRQAGAGESQVRLVGGEAGIGKTRLVQEFQRDAEQGGAVVAVGACLDQGAAGLPFAPFVAVLRALHREFGPALAEHAAGMEGDLARLLPELGDVASEGRTRLFETTVRLLERLATDRTVVVVLEDLHWADRSTRELLGYLVRAMPPARLLALATFRSDALHRTHPLRAFLGELDRLRGTVRHVDLAPLGRDEVLAQLAGIRGGTAPGPAAHEVYRRSEGNPFFVEELSLSEAAGHGMSDSLRELLLIRVESLAQPAIEVVRTAALDAVVEHELLAAVAGLDEDELLDGLREAVGARILMPVRALGADGYGFRHALLREAVLDDLLPGDRRRLGRRYAEALTADATLVGSDERAVRLAGYWYHAREPARALPALLDALAETRERHVYDAHLELLERAIELWDRVPEEQRRDLVWRSSLESYPPREERQGEPGLHLIDLLAEAARAALLSWAPERGLTFVRQAERLVDERADPLRAAWFWMERSRLTAFSDRGDGGAELDHAYDLVRDTPPSPTHADVLHYLASRQRLHDADENTVALAARAVELARATGAGELELNARATLAHVRAQLGDTETAIAELYELREAATRADAPRLLGRVNINLTDALHKLGRAAEAVEAGRAGVEELSRRRLYGAASFTAANVAESLFHLGEWDAAETLVEKWRDGSTSRGYASLHLVAARTAAARGAYDAVPALLAAARQQVSRLGEPQFELPVAVVELDTAAGRGRYAEAFEVLRTSLASLPLAGQDWYVTQLLISGAQLAGDTAGLPGFDAAERRDVVDRLSGAAAGLAPGWPALLPWLAAELARAREEDDPALWARAAHAVEPSGCPHVLARIRCRWAEALLAAGVAGIGSGPGAAAGTGADAAAGPREQAAELLAQAHAEAVRLGAKPLREDTELLAGRARIALTTTCADAPAARDPLDGFGLTAREREVLRLVAAGRSNRQIAEDLFISPKTASVHVSHMMAKLGAASRGEAAAIAHRMRFFQEPVGDH
ncbi:DUF2791 family P-loop domain-containing protein [Streptomyces sp. WMMC500]|uniref:helix-turn-helix transcriptional regulator n=1 Tax=Streptomyces sp. WMMC500 TaxID=3015154 RepID=UPI00248C7E1F|nr:LuxR family transcriptional regulator [Streptomyces sp. WMMC500]WBB64150.1 DUF2791 family P-loop domain-containing protein [Streptomyces sp. WMMC500]